MTLRLSVVSEHGIRLGAHSTKVFGVHGGSIGQDDVAWSKFTGEQPLQERTFCWRVNRSNRQQKAVRHGDWKYIQDGGVDLLFNLKDDIGERRDLGFHRPEILADLKARLKAWEEEMDRSPTTFVVR
jgi:arylsulfatase A-like enzyme